MTARECRSCGCTDDHACVVTEAPPRAWNQPGQRCWWVKDGLCSACTDRIDPRLTWRRGGNHVTEQGPGLSLKEKVAFSWVAFAMLIAASDLVGLL